MTVRARLLWKMAGIGALAVMLGLVLAFLSPQAARAEEPYPVTWSTGAIVPEPTYGFATIDPSQKSGPCAQGSYDVFRKSYSPIGGLAEKTNAKKPGRCAYISWTVNLDKAFTSSDFSVAMISKNPLNPLQLVSCGSNLLNSVFGGGWNFKLNSTFSECGFENACGIIANQPVPCVGIWDGSASPQNYYVTLISGFNLPTLMQFTIDPAQIPKELLTSGGLEPEKIDFGSVYGPSLGQVLQNSQPSPKPGATPGPTTSGTGFFDLSAFSKLPSFPWPPTPATFAHLGISAGLAIVLGILVLLPTSLLNNTLASNHGWFMAVLRRRRYAESEKKRSAGQMFLRALPVLVIGAIIAGFADPQFGFTPQSVRVVLTTLLAFISVNFLAAFVAWLFMRRSKAFQPPVLKAKWSFLIIVMITVLFSRLMNLQPVIVFGSLVTVEALISLKSAIDESKPQGKNLTEHQLRGRLESRITFITIVIGLAAWAIYTYITKIAPEWQPSLAVTIGEFAAVITIEALATLPIVLLPLRFMPGSAIYSWRKFVWFCWYSLGLTLFIFVLCPLQESWAKISVAPPIWIYVLIAYFVFAILVWIIFKIFFPHKKSLTPAPAPAPRIEQSEEPTSSV